MENLIMATNFEKNEPLVISTLFENSTNNVYNMSRREARHWRIPLSPEKNAWISIGEPDVPESIVQNPILEKLPHLKIDFWDVEKAIYSWGKDVCYPATESQIKTIFQFLEKHSDKNIFVNCAAGVSRSGAIARFMHDFYQYNWKFDRERANPNPYIYQKLLVELKNS